MLKEIQILATDPFQQLSLYVPWMSVVVSFWTAVTAFNPPKNKRQKKYRSVVTDIFDGTIVSAVQCLTCDRVSAGIATWSQKGRVWSHLVHRLHS